MSQNNFLLPVEEYQRSINPLADWVKQTAWYASKMLGKPIEQCEAHLRQKLKDGHIKIDNPTVVFYHREENRDRHKKTAPLTAYLGTTIANNRILAPTGTTYYHPSEKRSVIVEYLDENVAIRNKYKKAAAKFKAEGKTQGYKFNHQSQDAAKRDNNAVSGSFVADGSIIQNKSAHSTLTSITRSIASLSNASNERLIEGNRHYYNPIIIKNNIVSICSNSDFDLIREVVSMFGLRYPTKHEVMDCIRRSSDLYFRDRKKLEEIEVLVSRLTEEERAAFVYTGDLYHIRQCNQDFMRVFITRLSAKGKPKPVDDVITKLYKFDEQIVNYAHQICLSMMKGKGKDYSKLSDEEAFILYDTCVGVQKTVEDYKLFLKAFFLTKNCPPTVSTIQRQVRRAVVLSDTDSTMFSVDGWVKWYHGDLRFDDEGYAVGGSIMYMATQAIAHILAQFSANMNVERSRLFTLAMKPEYVFPVFAQTSVSKHYYTAMMVKEGSVYKDIEMEIKGVHMKDSTVPKDIIKGAHAEMERVIRTIMDGNKISLTTILRNTVEMERRIMASLAKGETTYLKRMKIKEKAAYKNGGDDGVDKTNYRHYTCWEQVFAPIYGHQPAPPYQAVSVPLTLDSVTSVKQWLASIEDRDFAARMASWMEAHKITSLSQLHLPMSHCQNFGIPKELSAILDSKRIVLALTKSYRNVVESHGYFSKSETMFCEQFAV